MKGLNEFLNEKKGTRFVGLTLDKDSHEKLIKETKEYIPKDWKIFAHHMTISLNKGLPQNLQGDIGKTKVIKATEIGISDMAIAVKVEGYYSDKDIPHVTIAVNVDKGGKPVMSNDIKNWKKLKSSIQLSGTIEYN